MATLSSIRSPGVYIQELPAGSRPIEGVGTAIAAFVGITADGPYDQAIKVNPKSAFAFNSRGAAHQRKGDYAKAAADYGEVTRLQPDNIDAWSARCWVRALAPGLLPLTFGWGREPAGLPRARSPLTLRSGRTLGASSAATHAGAMVPHPFP